MKSGFYYQGHCENVALAIRDYINSLDNFLTPQTANSPRAEGDTLSQYWQKKLSLSWELVS